MNIFYLLIIFLFCCSSCAVYSGPLLQPEINSLVVADRMKLASDKIAAEAADYGRGNYLLYYLDRGLVEYYAGLYPRSIRSFEKARKRFDELYTQSLSGEAVSWIANDYALPYRGSDYEYILINVFQALNYLAIGNTGEALVEARDMDSKYQVIDKLAGAARRRRFEDNGFARMFMGIVSESTGRLQDRDSARLFYQQSAKVYHQYYDGTYEPGLLKDRMNALEQADKYQGKAVVYLFQFVGFAPLKVPEIIPVPVDKGLMTQLVFPKFAKRYYDTRQGLLMAEGSSGSIISASTELGVSIEGLAIRDLESRKAVVLSKSVIRPALKYFIERKQKENIQKKYGRTAAEIFGLFCNLYNIYSEQADLRSWQSLPAEIRIARLELDPGQYRLSFRHLSEDGSTTEEADIGSPDVLAGHTYFFVSRGRR